MKSDMKIRGLEQGDVWDYENGFYWFSTKTRLNKMLAHFELYKTIINIPGHIFELGVYKGASLVRLATYRDVLENDFSRKIVGFDSFGEFPTNRLNLSSDLEFIEGFEGAGGHGLDKDELTSVLSNKGFDNFELVKGNVFDTLPLYLEQHPETRLSFLHLDMDVKEPTEFALELLYERVVPGGLIVFDDYNAVTGATISVDEFSRKYQLKIEKLPFYHVPSYLRKPI
jgi:hypothetical protein